MTGKIWRKSPPNTIDIPPNGCSKLFHKSYNVLSRASKQYLLFIGASSHKISELFSIKFAN